MESYLPTGILRPFIKTFMVVESIDGMEARVLPHTSQVLAFHFKGQVSIRTNSKEISIPTLAFSGMRKSFRLFNYEKNTGTILVMFKEAGAAAFFNEPLNELFEAIESLDSFFNMNETSILEEKIASAKNHLQRIAVVEGFLISKLTYQKPDQLILSAIQKIYFDNGNNRISDISKTLHLSQDAFEKRFRRIVGTSPKQFSSIVRMKSIIDNGKKNQNLTNIAVDAGFYDQSHFNKEFKLYTGLCPTDYFKIPAW